MNEDRLAEIGRGSDAPQDLVHLVAVLVFAGLSDEQGQQQLASVESRFDSDHCWAREARMHDLGDERSPRPRRSFDDIDAAHAWLAARQDS